MHICQPLPPSLFLKLKIMMSYNVFIGGKHVKLFCSCLLSALVLIASIISRKSKKIAEICRLGVTKNTLVFVWLYFYLSLLPFLQRSCCWPWWPMFWYVLAHLPSACACTCTCTVHVHLVLACIIIPYVRCVSVISKVYNLRVRYYNPIIFSFNDCLPCIEYMYEYWILYPPMWIQPY